MLFEGSIELETGYPPEAGYSSADLARASFDFDANKGDASDPNRNDIVFGLTVPNPDSFLVLGPSFGARGKLLQMGQSSFRPGEEVFSFEECSANVNEFGKGGTPIPAQGSSYCWLTNEGRLVEFFVDHIEEFAGVQGLHRIKISYVVWDRVVER